MHSDEAIEQVRGLRERGYAPREIARVLGIKPSEASRLVRIEAARRRSTPGGGDSDARVAATAADCFVSPGWCDGLGIEGHDDWVTAAVADARPGAGGVAAVLVAVPDGYNRVSTYGYLVDTWCLGVKNAIGPNRMAEREFEAFRRRYFQPWESKGLPIPIELAQHLVLGAVEYARTLGFEPHRDLRRARGALGPWDGPSSITFGKDGMPYYRSGPYDTPKRVLATLERTVGHGGYHYTVDLEVADDVGDGYRYTCSITDQDELSDVA